MKRRRQTKQDFIRFESHPAKDILRDAFMSGSQADGSIAVYFSQKVKPLSFKIPFKLALKYSPMWKIFFFFLHVLYICFFHFLKLAMIYCHVAYKVSCYCISNVNDFC